MFSIFAPRCTRASAAVYVDQHWILFQEAFELPQVACDDSLDGGLELQDRRALAAACVDVPGKFRPTFKAVFASDFELRVGKNPSPVS